MEDADFSDEFCGFIQSAIPACEAAELLLLLARTPERQWTAPEAVAQLRPEVSITEAEATRYLELFQARGLVSAEPDGRARYQPKFYNLEALVKALAQAYNERPVTLIRLIYALRDTRIQSFADAFKIRRR